MLQQLTATSCPGWDCLRCLSRTTTNTPLCYLAPNRSSFKHALAPTLNHCFKSLPNTMVASESSQKSSRAAPRASSHPSDRAPNMTFQLVPVLAVQPRILLGDP